MTMNTMLHKLIVTISLLALGQTASANVISIFDQAGNAITVGGQPNATQYTASCGDAATICMEAFYNYPDAVVLSDQLGTGLSKINSGKGELPALNAMLASLGADQVDYVNKVDVAGNLFTTDREYFSIKQATWTVFFVNNSDGAITVDFGPNSFSHWTEYGDINLGGGISDVPVPAALPLFMSALGLLGFSGWRRNRRVA